MEAQVQSHVQTAAVQSWQAKLAATGFRPRRNSRDHHLGRLTFQDQGGWAVLTRGSRRSREHPLPGSLGAPGLWRSVRSDEGRALQYVFEMPPWVRSESTDTDTFRDAIDWAVATEKGSVPSGWVAPPLDETESLLSADRLTVRAGSIVRQGRLIRESGRLALRFPIFSDVPADLSLTRRRWLEALLEHQQDRWRLVRVGIDETASIRAEVDLSGAPSGLMPRLLDQALDALRLLVQTTIESVDFLLQRPEEGRALDTLPCGTIPPQEGDTA